MPKLHTLTCTHCGKSAEYQVTWTVRRKRSQPPRGASEADVAKFQKAQSYMVRRDDMLPCKNERCRKRFEIEGIQSVVYMQEAATGSVDERAARLKAAFGRRGSGAKREPHELTLGKVLLEVLAVEP